ncbi:hypothetical protein ACHAQJ_003499 [Trichoderma viride]
MPQGLAYWTPDTPSSEGDAHYHDRGASYSFLSPEERHTGSNAPAVYFIAQHIFHQARLNLPQLSLPVPNEIVSLIGDSSNIRSIATTFFGTVYPWMPIISKKEFFVYLLNPLGGRQIELHLLALCMQLCCRAAMGWDRDNVAKLDIYRAAKHFHLEVETAGALSIHVLQAAILIAIYEIGHAIYPAAYLTVGACARYGIALGIDKLSTSLMGDEKEPWSWIQVEERRRVWWAVTMLDRFLNLSNPTRQLATEDPAFNSYLPADDKAWEEGISKPEDAVNISTGFTLQMGLFSRLAQATYLTSQALRSVSLATGNTEAINDSQAAQLRRTLIALVHEGDREATIRQLEFCPHSALCFSAILLLQDHRWQEMTGNASNDQVEPEFGDIWDEARSALERLSTTIAYCYTDWENNSEPLELVSFFIIHVIYQAAYMRIILGRGNPDEQTQETIQTSKQVLSLIDKRWRLAGKHLPN